MCSSSTEPPTSAASQSSSASPIDSSAMVQNRPSTDPDQQHQKQYRDPICPCWTRCTQWLHNVISSCVTRCALHAVKHPKAYIATISILSLALIAIGFFTNFRLVLDLDQVFTPLNSKPQQHAEWIYSTQGFPNQTRMLQMVFHNHGNNVLHVAQARRVVEAVDIIRTTPGYSELCAQGNYLDFNNQKTCRLFSVSGYWENHSLALFDKTIPTDQDLRTTMSAMQFADGSPVLHDSIVGKYQKDENGTLTEAQSYLIRLELPDLDGETDALETDLLSRLDTMRRDWMEMDQNEKDDSATALSVDFVTIFAYQIEFLRAIMGELYLVALSALLMVGFTCLVFYRRDPNKSRANLGLASVTTIFCSILTGNGIMFLFGVPYSTVHQMLPFIIFGIGLDDTFIITGAYFRTNSQDSIEDRIQETMQEVGWSISLTTLTTVFAFTLGYFSSSFPGVHWCCLSAVTTITIDFYYQISYFIAFLTLDEQRLRDNCRDCCFWLELPKDNDEADDHNNYSESNLKEDNAKQAAVLFTSHTDETLLVDGEDNQEAIDEGTRSPMPPEHADETDKSTSIQRKEDVIDDRTLPEKIMSWYADILLRPLSKVLVLAAFGLFFAACCISATRMTQAFDVGSYLTEDSYLRNIFTSLNEYSNVVRPIALYFRHVDQADPDIQRQMIQYVDDMESLDQVWSVENITTTLANQEEGFMGIDKVRPFCWVRDFQELGRFFESDPFIQAAFNNMTFNEKLDFLLTDKLIREVYGQDIVRDEEGSIVNSRCYLFLQDLDLKDVEEQIEMLFTQRDVTLAQPINQKEPHLNDWAFFAYDEVFGYWEAYSVSIDEMVFTIIAGVVAVTFISFIFIPHWTGAVLVFPLILVLYINMLGTLNFLGLHINGFTYICIVVSIGVLVDFLIHVLLRYYECSAGKTRDERVKETLETMGASILIGGATTFLAVVPISISSVKIFMTVFNAFFAMVSLGITHGLILLPVILSFVGPTTNVHRLEVSSGKVTEVRVREVHPTLMNGPTQDTLVSSPIDEVESAADSDEIQSLTSSAVEEVSDTSDTSDGSPKSIARGSE